jgi:hypothetical protein
MGIDPGKIPGLAAHWENYVAAFVQSIQANGLLSRFVSNPAVTGAYAEVWVHSLVKRMLGQRFRISTGAVIRPSDASRGLASVPQCDLIVWDSTQFPAVFETDGFALVPFHAVRAIIEVKRGWKADLFTQLKERRKCVPDQRVFGVVLQHRKPLFELPVTSNWFEWQVTKPDYIPVGRLLDKDLQACTHDVLALIYFLAQIAGHRDPNARTATGVASRRRIAL